MHQVLAVDTGSPAAARRALWRRLPGLGLAAQATDDLVLAVNEAVSNAVCHAYPAEREDAAVQLTVEVGPNPDGVDCVIVTVADIGRWRPVPERPRYRGHGMPLMQACTDWMDIESGARGTTVTLASPPLVAV
jgi:anti-sigma regulatory factor (Ser/Thr protein kinase)